MNTFTITTENFLEWYLNSGADDEIASMRSDIGERIINELFEKGTSTLTIQNLFDEADFESIQLYRLEEFGDDADEELGETYEEYEVNLI